MAADGIRSRPLASRKPLFDFLHDWRQVGHAVDDIMRARALQLVHRCRAPFCEVVRSQRRRIFTRQAETIAADRYADRPSAPVDSLRDADLRVIDLDYAPGG